MTATVDFTQNVAADFTTSVSPTITSGPVDLYVDNINGSDGYPGTSALPLKTLVSAETRLPDIIAHRVIIRVLPYDAAVPNVGAYTWPTFRARILRAPILIVGIGERVIASGVAQAGSSQVALVTPGGLVADEYLTCSVRINSGGSLGDRRLISENTVTDVIPSCAFTAALGAGDAWDIIKPLVRVLLPAVMGGGTVFARGTGTKGGVDASSTPGLHIINLSVEGPAWPNYILMVRDIPIYFYGVNFVNYGVVRSNAAFCAGTEQENNAVPYQTCQTITTYLPAISPSIGSCGGWGIAAEQHYLEFATTGAGFDGHLVCRDYLFVRRAGSAADVAVATIRGGRCGMLIVGMSQEFRSAFVVVQASKSEVVPHINFKLRYAGANPLVTVRNGWLYIGHCDLGTVGTQDGILAIGNESNVYVYRSYGSVAGIALRCKDGGRIQLEGAQAFAGVVGDLSEDDGVTLRAMATLLNGTYFRGLTVDAVTHVVSGEGGLISRED